jgi:hypothetical protein
MGRALAKPITGGASELLHDGFRIAREYGRKRPYEFYRSVAGAIENTMNLQITAVMAGGQAPERNAPVSISRVH